jgi:hypothetical protein
MRRRLEIQSTSEIKDTCKIQSCDSTEEPYVTTETPSDAVLGPPSVIQLTQLKSEEVKSSYLPDFLDFI